MKLSIVIPVYNESATIEKIVAEVLAVDVGMEKELVLVDDCSRDGTTDVLKRLAQEHPDWKVLFHERNQGKGAALRTGFAAATGDVLVIQDADLEYDPRDYRTMLGPILDGHADVVYGSRFLGGGPHRVVFFWHYLGNRLLTTLSNMLTDMNLTDMEVCYKMFRREVLKDIRIEEDRFGFEVEITAKVARGKKWRIYEVPVSYYGRSYAEGKKITWRDGFWALWCILKYGLTDRGVTPGSESEPLSVTDRAMVLVANGFGLGNAPVASGTVGALLGLLVAFVVTWFPMMWEPLVAAVLCLVAVPICDVAERHYKSKDDGRIVADEFLTFPICLLGLPWLDHPWLLVVAFGVSRACDVIKPAPARQAQDIKGGWGIVLDDAVANVYALVINHFVWILFG